jgi:outer membrane protein
VKKLVARYCPALAAILVLAILPFPAHAENTLESIRRTDLNDYAFGVALSVSEDPYVGGETSTYFFPYLTSLTHPALTKQWLYFQDGDIGLRYVSDGGWEAGVVIRPQTLGLGPDNEEAEGLFERRWSIESGPKVAWRGWPIHIVLKHYWEILDRHDGTTTELSLELPKSFDWGYVVPSLEFKHMSEAYVDYYYGVDLNETRPWRPAYAPDSAMNPYLAFRVGYRLTPRWLLSFKAGLEFLDSSITNSPIVDKDKLWSASLGIAYNAEVFRATDYDSSDGPPASLEIRVGAFNSSVESTVQRFAEDGTPGDQVDVESVLGVPDSETTIQTDVIMRFAFYHRLEASNFSFGRNSLTVLERDIVFGGETFPAGTEVQTTQDLETWQLLYGYSLLRDAQKEFGLSIGVHFTRARTAISALTTGQFVELETDVPLPTIGAFAGIELPRHWSIDAAARVFALEFDQYEGSMAYLSVRLERELGKHFAAGLGFNYYSTRLEGLSSGVDTVYESTYSGPVLYMGMRF